MSSPRYSWWGYVKSMIRKYPERKDEYERLKTQKITAQYGGTVGRTSEAHRVTEDIALRTTTEDREFWAVHRAIEETKKLATGDARLALIDIVFWKRTHTLEGAAVKINYSLRRATVFHTEFIRLVAKFYGLLDK